MIGIKVATLDSVMTFQRLAAVLRSHPDKLLVTGEDRFLGYSVMAGATAALVGMGAALPDVQAELLHAWRDRQYERFVALSALCDRLAQATFIEPMEGYIRRMLWAAAAEGAHSRARRATTLGDRPCRTAEREAVEQVVSRCARSSSVTSSASAPGSQPTFAAHVRDTYRIDLSARYLGFTLPHPIGKGSGQLSLNQEQLETDRDAGLAFVVLKTVIAEDASGRRAMEAWAIHETRMRVEKVRSASGLEGWTVTWKGRGWDRSFDDYLALVRAAGDMTRSGAMRRRSVGKVSSAAARRAVSRRGVQLHDRAAGAGLGRGRAARWRRISLPRSPATRSPTSASVSCAGSGKCPS